MSFPPAFLDELRARLTLSDIVGKRLRLTRAGREFKACCPFHNEKSPSFYVNDDKQFFHCFGCGAHGDVIGFAMRHDRLSFPEAVENLAAQAGLAVPRDTPVEREKFDK
jgi:DNA primase